METGSSELKRTLTPLLVWGLGVGYVISGMYLGWNLGLEKGGTLGLAIAVGFIIINSATFTLSYTELACAIPKAGGAFDYGKRAFGKDVGFIVGIAQSIEFIFAPPAIAYAIGAYFNIFFPQLSVLTIAILAYVIFTGINMYGVKVAATFELIITIFAVAELLLFSGLTLPHFESGNITHNAFPNGWAGVFASIPFAIWFFLGIEGVANLAEETINPQRTVAKGFGSALVTLIVLCILVFLGSVGVAGWEAVVFGKDGAISDSPLPLAFSHIVGDDSFLYHLLITVGLFGLVASFHGLMLAAGRSTFEFGRVGFAPSFLGRIHGKFKTPANALLINMIIGIIALLTGRTGDIITISVFGALSLYVISMFALLRLRKSEPDLHRPYKVPFFPAIPVIAICISLVSLVSLAIFNIGLCVLYILIIGICYGIFKLWSLRKPRE